MRVEMNYLRRLEFEALDNGKPNLGEKIAVIEVK